MELNTQVADLLFAVEEGYKNPLEAFIVLRDAKKVIDAALSQLQSEAIDEAQRYGEKTFKHYGREITIKEGGVKYDYSVCGDPVLSGIDARLKAVNAEVKQRQNFLKACKGGETIMDETTGEVVRLVPPLKKSTTTLQIK